MRLYCQSLADPRDYQRIVEAQVADDLPIDTELRLKPCISAVAGKVLCWSPKRGDILLMDTSSPFLLLRPSCIAYQTLLNWAWHACMCDRPFTSCSASPISSPRFMTSHCTVHVGSWLVARRSQTGRCLCYGTCLYNAFQSSLACVARAQTKMIL